MLQRWLDDYGDVLQAFERRLDRDLRPHAGRQGDELITRAQAGDLLACLRDSGLLDGLVRGGSAALPQPVVGLLFERLFGVFASLGGIAFINAVAAGAIAAGGSDAQRRRFLEPLVRGDLVACVGITEPDVGSNVAAIRTRATRTASGWRISGRKTWISSGGIADVCLLVCRMADGEGLSRFLVPCAAPGVQRRELAKLGLKAWSTAEITFDDVDVPADALFGRPGDALSQTLRLFETARCYVAMGAVGVADAALKAAVGYAQQRQQWGGPIARHQLVQSAIAEMATAVQTSRLLALHALDLLDRGLRADTESSMAKWYATEAAVRVTSQAMQVHGAYGLSAEFPMERYFRDARTMTVPDGTTDIQKLIIARNLLGVPAFETNVKPQTSSRH